MLILSTVTKIRTQRFADSLRVTLWCAVLTQLCWFLAEFAFFHLFSNTPKGVAFLREEMAEDFAHSGGTNYQAFVIAVMYGVGFFHLLISSIISLILGALGAGIGRLYLMLTRATVRTPNP